MEKQFIRYDSEKLKDVVIKVFQSYDIPIPDSEIIADNLVAADLRGISSHGVARLKRYIGYIEDGKVIKESKYNIVKETPVSYTIDGCNSLGQPNSKRAMDLTIEKAKDIGCAFTVMRRSNHYGIAGYYAMMALEHDMLGISLTNSAPLVVPTFSKKMFLGTNPIAVSIPADQEYPIVVDMATSVIPRGKLEVYNRKHEELKPGWVLDTDGNVITDAGLILKNMVGKLGGGILPLGGAGEEHSGHKGYGLSLLVDIFTGLLSSGATGDNVYSNPQEANVCHFFGAIKIDNFIEKDKFKNDIDKYIKRIKKLEKIETQDTIYIHGEKEYLNYEENKTNGVNLHIETYNYLKDICNKNNIDF